MMLALAGRRRGAGGVVPAPSPPPPPGETWQELGKLQANMPPQDDFDGTRPYRNAAWLRRGQRTDTYGEDGTNVTLKTSGAGKGYPVAGTTFGSVYMSQLTSGDAGIYHLKVKGNNPFVQKGQGVLSSSTFAGGYTTATLTMTGPFSGGDIIAIGWNSIDANFQELEIMLPDYSVGDNTLLTAACVAHLLRFLIIRFMDLLRTNNREDVVEWVGSGYDGGDDFDKYPNSLKAAFDIANALSAEAWVNSPPLADDDFLANFAVASDGYQPPGKKWRWEFSNEPWNYAFPAHGKIMNEVFEDAALCCGLVPAFTNSNGLQNIRTDRRITSVSRNGSGVVDIRLNFDPATAVPGFNTGASIFDHSDADGAIAAGVVSVSDVTNMGGGVWRVRYQHSVHSAVGSGNLDATWFGSYIYLDANNELVTPTTVVDIFDNPRPNPRGIKNKWEMRQGLRRIYEAAVTAGIEDNVRICKSVQLDIGESWYHERHGLAFAIEKYGSLDWLFANGGGLFPALYLRPRGGVPATFNDAADVYAELEIVRESLKQAVLFWTNIGATFGQDAVDCYEGGIHTDDDDEGNTTVIAALRAFHLSEDAGTILKDTWQDFANRSRGGIAYFHVGSTRSFANGVSMWAPVEGSLADVDDIAQPKNAALTTLADTVYEAELVAGENSGTIRIADVMPALGGEGQPGNGMFAFGADAGLPSAIGYAIDVWANADGDYNAGIKAGSTDTSDQITLLVNEVQQGAKANLSSYAGDSTVPATAITRTVTLTRGWHRLRAKFDADRVGYSGMAGFIFNPA